MTNRYITAVALSGFMILGGAGVTSVFAKDINLTKIALSVDNNRSYINMITGTKTIKIKAEFDSRVPACLERIPMLNFVLTVKASDIKPDNAIYIQGRSGTAWIQHNPNPIRPTIDSRKKDRTICYYSAIIHYKKLLETSNVTAVFQATATQRMTSGATIKSNKISIHFLQD